jgi:hypothetical protein
VKRLVLGVLLLAAPACDPGGPTEPEATTVTLTLTNPANVERPQSLRLAVVWRTGQTSGSPWLTTFDHALSDTEKSRPIRVELPEAVNLAVLPNSVTITVDCAALEGSQGWPGIRPVWVVYQDLNQNQRLDGDGSDRVMGISDQQMAAFVDLEKVLSQVSLEGAECLRQANGGGFSPFVSGTLGGSAFSASLVPIEEFLVPLSPTTYPGASLTCGSSLTWSEAPVQSPTLLSVAPDVGLDVCADDETPCSPVAYDNDWKSVANVVSIPGYYRWPRCVTAGELEILWVGEQRYECDDCTCTSYLQEHGWVVSRSAPPIDWPCGSLVETCMTATAQVEVIPPDCALN